MELNAQEPAKMVRQSALVLILLRAGMALDINALKRLRFVAARPMSLGGVESARARARARARACACACACVYIMPDADANAR